MKESLDTRDWKVAQNKITEWELSGKRSKTGKVADVCEEFLADLKARQMSKGTIKKYRGLLVSEACNSLATAAGGAGIETIRAMEISFVGSWRQTWADAGITQLKKLERVRVFFRWCVDRGYCEVSPAASVKPPKVRHVPTLPFERDEVDALVSAALEQGTPAEGRRLRAYILVCRYTGLRRGDAAILACNALRGDELLLRQEKTGEPLYTLLPPFLVDELRHVEKLSERHWFWTGASTAEVVGGNYARSFRRLCEKRGIKKGHLHRLRDTFAVESLNAGVPMEVVSKLLGHASIRVTEKHYSPWVSSRQAQVKRELAKAWAFDPMAASWGTSKEERKVQ